jgi:pyruvate dehydrogenase E2 component (dihydrolipoamide acetyltransferase)
VAAPARRVLASPKARRLAREHGLPIEEIAGTGPHGAVQAGDVEAAASAPAVAAPSVAGTEPGTELPVSSAWRTMATRMQQAWQEVPHFFLQRDVDATRLNSWREAVRTRAGYERVTHTDLLVKLCAGALDEHPRVNAQWRDGSIVGSNAVNVGIAVATDDALIVPVVHDAARIGLREVAERRSDLVARARDRKLRPDDVTGGTFTISNLGMFGVDAFQAIVPAPQAAILAVGRIRDTIVAVDGAPAVRPTLTLTLSFDHRVVDGAAGARFLDTLAALVEEPAGLVR